MPNTQTHTKERENATVPLKGRDIWDVNLSHTNRCVCSSRHRLGTFTYRLVSEKEQTNVQLIPQAHIGLLETQKNTSKSTQDNKHWNNMVLLLRNNSITCQLCIKSLKCKNTQWLASASSTLAFSQTVKVFCASSIVLSSENKKKKRKKLTIVRGCTNKGDVIIKGPPIIFKSIFSLILYNFWTNGVEKEPSVMKVPRMRGNGRERNQQVKDTLLLLWTSLRTRDGSEVEFLPQKKKIIFEFFFTVGKQV